jgi:beta-phosphoglucomutase
VPSGFRGAIFDVDGVLVDSPHEQAWREGLRSLMEGEWSDIRGQTTWAPERFTPQVYQQVMSGKPRMSAARAVLDHFGVPGAASRVEAYGQRKQEVLIPLVEQGRFTAYPDALRFVLGVKGAGMVLAAASSSKNAGLFLARIRLDAFAAEHGLTYDFLREGLTLLELFDADISGRDFAEGKPHPEIFLTAASELGVEPAGCFVVEDAFYGLQAAKAGGMAALGLSCAGDEELLAGAAPDLLVSSLDDVDRDALLEGRLASRG